MKIGLIGYGKMGKKVEECAIKRGHAIVAKATAAEWDLNALKDADIFIEFTQPDATLRNIEKLASLKKPILIGTTGWYAQLERLEQLVEKHSLSVLYASNFSVGIQLLLKILAHTAKLMEPCLEYDVAGVECHHNQKKDAPSGTALELTKVIEKNMPRTAPLSFSSVRCGSIPGTHSILFDGPYDTITINHTARSQEGFAMGAVKAAEWLLDKKGLYTLEHYIEEKLYGH